MRLCHALAPLLGFLLSSPVAAAPQGGVPLDKLLSSPFPTGLVAAPSGGKVAWVFNDRGRRNVWIAEPPDYKGRPLTKYAEDDGQELGGLAWAPDGRSLCYVRGNGLSHGETLNPRSLPKAEQQAVWVIAVSGGEPRRLGDGNSPSISPKGDRVVFLHKGQVWAAPLDGGKAAEPLFQTRGQVRQLRWSPDGSALAFVSERGDHNFIGVYSGPKASLRWLDPGVDRDSDPVWSPDGKQIAFLRVPTSREPFTFGPQPTAEPWSIRVAAVADGKGRQVWKAEPGPGSAFHGVVADNQLFWGEDDHLVFPWEADGWTHLYAVPLGGGPAKLLTPGKFEVESATLSPDRSRLVYSSNQDDIDRRHLWIVPVRGGRPPTALTRGIGIEWSPVVTGDGTAIAFLRSDARRPAWPAIQAGGEFRDLAERPADFPTDALVEPTQVTITAADGRKAPAQLFLPPGLKPGERRPAVLYTHGGSRRQMLLGWHMMGGYSNHYALHQYLALRGFVVLSLNYRSGIGYGLEFREAPAYGAHGASELNDLIGAARYLRDRSDVDPDRVGLWGGSYGGYLTALGLSRAPELFAAGVDIHGVYDWNVVIRNFERGYDPLVQRDTARIAHESSPVSSVKNWRAPVLVIHGDHDPDVPFQESVRLVEDLRKQKVDVETLVFPDEAHGFLTHEAWLRCLQATADYLERRLVMKAGAAEKEIVPQGATVEKVAGGYKFTEGPAADADGNLFFTDSPRNLVLVLRPSGKVDVWDKESGDANGMRFDTKGRLLACCGEGGARAVIRYDKEGKKTVLADRYNGKRLTAPNDLCVDRQGRIYFTDPCYGKRPADGQEKYAVYRIEAEAGEPVPNKVTRVIDDVDTPNGIALSPDGKTLYVADTAARKDGPHTLIAYDIGADGKCKRRAVLHDFKERRGIDGMVVDTEGNIYGTAESGERTGVYIFSPEGKQLGFIRTPETATNCVFGDRDLKTLYITAGGSVYKVRLNATGYPPYPAGAPEPEQEKPLPEAWDYAPAMKKATAKFRGKQGVVLHVGDSMTIANPYGQWARSGKGKTPEDVAVLEWMHTGANDKTDGWWLCRTEVVSERAYTAVGGMQSTHLLSGGNRGNLTLEQMLKEFNPQMVVLQVGIYDADAYRPVKEYRANMAKAVDLILDNGTICILSTSAPLYNRLELTRQYNEALRELAKERGLPLIDLEKEILKRRPEDWNGTLQRRNNIHLTAREAGGDPAAAPTADNLGKSGYLLRGWLSVQKIAEVKRRVLDNPEAPEEPSPAATVNLKQP
jgi:dipeptidyl aminopeptidase/acylaminoacyl peptidase/sugar lactone lactonase YvrE